MFSMSNPLTSCFNSRSGASVSGPSEDISCRVPVSSLSYLLEASSLQSAEALVWSNFGLSAFDYPLNRENRNKVQSHLKDLTFEIVAVWVVARPLNGRKNTTLKHWCVKIQAPPALVSIDFLEHGKKGAFGLQQTAATDAELEDFLKYYVRDAKGKKMKPALKWDIISSVTPSAASSVENTIYYEYLDEHELKTLKAFMKNSNGDESKEYMNLKKINIDRRACDVADFLQMWTESADRRNQHLHKTSLSTIESCSSRSMRSSLSPSLSASSASSSSGGFYRKKSKSKEKTYNPITGNCQQFAAELFEYLVGHKPEYKEKVNFVKDKAQSPWDKKQWSMNAMNSDHDALYDDDDAKQEIIEEEEEVTKGDSNNQEQKPIVVTENENLLKKVESIDSM